MTDDRPATDAVTCRLLGPDDSALIERADDDVFDTRPRADFIRDFFDDPRALLAGAIDTALDDGGRLVGMASAHWYNHPDKPRQLFIDEVGVAGSHRRRGLAARLLALLLARGRALGCTDAWVGTEAGNVEARALYAHAAGRADGGGTVIYSFDLTAPPPQAR